MSKGCEKCRGQDFPGCPNCEPERFKPKEQSPTLRAVIDDGMLVDDVADKWVEKNQRMNDGHVFVLDIINSYRAAVRERIKVGT